MNTQTTISRPETQQFLNTCAMLAAVALILVAVVGPDSLHAAETASYDFRSAASAAAGSITAANPAQGFESIISSDGVSVRADGADWEFGLSLTGLGRGEQLVAVEPAAVSAQSTRAELTRADLVEWYHNDERGLEQGFTIHQRPQGEGPLVLEMTVSGGLLALLEPDGRSVSLLPPGGSLAVLSYSKLVVEDRAGRVLDAWLEVDSGAAAGHPRLRIVVDDAGADYPLLVDPLLSSPAWSSAEWDTTLSVAWGDWDADGDLDLAAGNWDQPNRVYNNSGGALTAAWASADTYQTTSVAWGDWDGDGDLDLTAGNFEQPNRVYSNGWLSRPDGLPQAPTSPVLGERPGSADAAYFHSSGECLASPVELSYTLVDEQSDSARRIRVEYSVTGIGQWFEATEATGAGSHGLVDLTASPAGDPHQFVWDAAADGVDSAEGVSLRVVVLHQTSTRVPGLIQRAAMAAASPPFRICAPVVIEPLLFADGFESGDTSEWN